MYALRTLRTPALRASLVRTYASTASAATTPIVGKPQTLENNLQTESNKLSKTLQKFWENVELKTNENNDFELQLDAKTVRTPLGNDLIVPSNRPLLANLLYHEWKSLSNSNIKTHSLPFTSLISRVIDLETATKNANEEDLLKVGKKSDIIDQLLRYLDTDTLLIFSPKAEYEGGLRKAQEELYRPVIAQIEELLGSKLTFLDSDVDGLRGNRQPLETSLAAREFLHTLSYYDLVAVEKVTLTAKSLICGLLTVQNKSLKTSDIELEEIAKLATLEIIYQTERWGEVEDTHDVDYQDIRRHINSCGILAFQE
ncbi:hypothetical protein WICPIJ_005043 [Wickerhamomyces pijperi]|uniref:Uncharacterized protein n=1 Tax=Wickerhamomyces pijperi TaxID=599730 RepID=A0A9P8Q499_WICPI|nr:hypothetical protein WICPIJ_005043 [Wickerhamomyces pijperi]